MNFRNKIFLITGIFFLIKIFFLLRYHLPIWDEAVYLGMGKYLYSLGSSGLWESIRPIGLPLFIGWAWKLGFSYIRSAEFIILLFALGNIYLTFLIGKRVFNKEIALFSSLLLALTPTFFLYSSYILTELPSTFFVLLAVYFFLEKKYAFSGFSSALAFMFKFTQGLILPSLLLIFFIDFIRNKNFKLLIVKSSKVILPFLITILPFLTLNYFMYRAYTSKLYHSIFRPFILGMWHQANPSEWVIVPGKIITYVYNYLYYVITPIVQNPLLIFAFFGLFYYFKKKIFVKDNYKFIVILIPLLLSFLYFTYIHNKQARFLTLLLPLVCLLASFGFCTFYNNLKERKKILLKVLTIAILFSLLLVNINFIFWRPTLQPKIVDELYTFFSKSNIKGHILTAEPVFCVYNDNYFIPYYFMLEENIVIYNEWERNLKPEAIVFSPNSFYCEKEDNVCINKKEKLFNNIMDNNELVLNQTFYEYQQYYLFLTK